MAISLLGRILSLHDSMGFQGTLKNIEAASRYLVAIKTSHSACMDYEMRAGPADIDYINEGQRRIRRFRQLLAT